MNLRAKEMNIRVRSRTLLEGRRNSRGLLKLITITALALGCSLGLLGGHRFLTSHRYFQIRQVEVQGLRHLSKEEIVGISGLSSGDNIFRADISWAGERLLNQPWIADAAVARRFFPPVIEIRVEEREPFAILDTGQLYIVDKEGVILQPYSGRVDMGLPTIRLRNKGERKEEATGDLDVSMGLVRRILADEFLKGVGISGVDILGAGRVSVHTAANGMEIRISEGQADKQVSRLEALMERSGIRPEQIKYIDLSYNDQIVMGLN